MNITARMGAPLSQVIGASQVTLTLPEGATVADLLVALGQQFPEFDAGLRGKGLRVPTDQVLYALFIDARSVPFERVGVTPLADGDQVYFFLPIAGG